MSTLTVTSSIATPAYTSNSYYLNSNATLIINAGHTLDSAGPPDITWNQENANGVTIDNAGLLLAVGDKKRVFDTTDKDKSSETASNFVLFNTGTIIAGGDVMRDQYVNDGGTIAITNSGLIEAGKTLDGGSTIDGRDFNFQQDLPVVTKGTTIQSFSLLTINNSGTMLAADDGIRVTNQTPSASSVSGFYNATITGDIFITNTGTIESEGSLAVNAAYTGAGSGQAIDLADVNAPAGHVLITNGTTLDSTALIEATDNDAIRPGNNGIVINYGTIDGAEVFYGASIANPHYQAKDAGVYAQEFETVNVTNYGLIEGAKSGVYGERDPATETLASDEKMTAGAPSISSDVIVLNYGTIIGEDGKAVGADYGSVYNAGTIIAEDNPALLRGDGDGIDINYTANVTNAAGGVIEARGSEGVDDNGRVNVADGLAIGGGTVYNAGTIISANNGITVNNDSNPDGSRSGNADLVLVNAVGGVIEGEDGYAIRSENKAGLDEANAPISSIDYDTVTNYGTIISDGTVPDFSSTFEVTTYTTTTVNGHITYGTIETPDTFVNGTIEGVGYSGSDPADDGSIRFIEGDGSAIQLGEGNDILNEYGVITATDNLAVNLEGGNNIMNLYAGAAVSGVIDGGLGGTNTLNVNTPDGMGATPDATSGTLDQIIDFATLDVIAGSWTLEDTETYANLISIANGASLIVNNGADLVVGPQGSLTGELTLLQGGTVDYQGLAFSGTTIGTVGSNGVLVITEGAHSVTLDLAPSDAGDHVAFGQDAGTGTELDLAICYLAGTRILTPTGEVPVESLTAGDAVVTRDHGIQPIKWIGRQSFSARFISNNRAKLPVRIRAGALGVALPARDLFVSPGHSLLLGGQLILAKSLVNGVTITQDATPDQVDYYQIELDMHDCVIAEGTYAETYADGPGLRTQFHNYAEFMELYPDHVAPAEINLCRPRPERGPLLDSALRSVVALAAAGVAPGPLRGFIDLIRADGSVDGWACDTAQPELPVLLEFCLHGKIIGTALACDERHDLVAAGIGNGRCAFSTAPLPGLTPDFAAFFTVRRAADGAQLSAAALRLAA